jgi:site-specific DNA recombinase
VLGLAEFDEVIFRSQIKQMQVPEANKVVYIFQDDREVETVWQNRSRKFSWTEKAKLKARERALAHQKGVKL